MLSVLTSAGSNQWLPELQCLPLSREITIFRTMPNPRLLNLSSTALTGDVNGFVCTFVELTVTRNNGIPILIKPSSENCTFCASAEVIIETLPMFVFDKPSTTALRDDVKRLLL
ncbi:hypothetical protein ElyMa_002491000 [Elysia marginata]|uniref:Uncharacterized protein n=1 Tax=Elysia marginata TaxID=1093978 RepID=A0AAV4GQY4_9GAST|nr:hypothetical protein ElyMa_002491000 [Elysia marginata]